MALKRTEKEQVVSDLKNVFDTSGSVVFTRFDKLTVEESNAMRKDLRAQGVNFKVAKKTLARIALKESKVAADMGPVEGEMAVAYSEDEIAAAREILVFQKRYAEKIFIEGGVFQGEVMDRDRMVAIAQIPGMQTLRGMFVNLINSPIQRIAVVLDQIAQTKA